MGADITYEFLGDLFNISEGTIDWRIRCLPVSACWGREWNFIEEIYSWAQSSCQTKWLARILACYSAALIQSSSAFKWLASSGDPSVLVTGTTERLKIHIPANVYVAGAESEIDKINLLKLPCSSCIG